MCGFVWGLCYSLHNVHSCLLCFVPVCCFFFQFVVRCLLLVVCGLSFDVIVVSCVLIVLCSVLVALCCLLFAVCCLRFAFFFV